MNEKAASNGQIAQVMGPVVDVVFPDGALPDIYFALTTDQLRKEVDAHVPDASWR